MKTKMTALLVLCGALLAPKALGASYTITVNQRQHGTVTPGTSTVFGGTNKTFTFTPDAGYMVWGIEIDMSSFQPGSTANGTVLTYTFTNVQSDHSIVPYFFLAPEVVGYSPDNGASVGAGDFLIFSVSATDHMGDGLEYQWYVDGVAQAGATTQDWAYTPALAQVGTHAIQCRIRERGVLTCAYVAQNWTVTVYDPAASYTITASAGAGGIISPNGAQTMAATGSKTFAITADPGYAIGDVLVDGVSVGVVSSYTFTNVVANHTIAASFTSLPHFTINASVTGTGGTISPSGAVVVLDGHDQTFTFTPQKGYEVDRIAIDLIWQDAADSYTFTNVNSDHGITVTFAEKPSSGGGGGGGGGGGCSMTQAGSSGTLGWMMPYAAMAMLWLASRCRRVKA